MVIYNRRGNYMSTRSRIGKELKNGKVKSIYCHNDGYISYTGKILYENYDLSNIDELLKLGDLSVIDYDTYSCEAYHRDYGEEYYKPRVDSSVRSFVKEDDGVDYKYLLDKNGIWYVYKIIGEGIHKHRILEDAIYSHEDEYYYDYEYDDYDDESEDDEYDF